MAEEKFMKIPYFGKGTSESLDRALTTGRFKDGLDKALFYFSTDTKQWVLVDTDKTIHKINSYEGEPGPGPGTEGSVVRVNQLPPILEADAETLYIVGEVVYSFDGSAFYPTYQDCYDKIIGSLPDNTTVIQYIDRAIEGAGEYTDAKVANVRRETATAVAQLTREISNALDEAKQYTDDVNEIHVVQGGG